MTSSLLKKQHLENGKNLKRLKEFRSEEALELHTYLKKLGNMPEFCNEEYLVNFFLSIFFQRMGIERMDALLSRMSNL